MDGWGAILRCCVVVDGRQKLKGIRENTIEMGGAENGSLFWLTVCARLDEREPVNGI